MNVELIESEIEFTKRVAEELEKYIFLLESGILW